MKSIGQIQEDVKKLGKEIKLAIALEEFLKSPDFKSGVIASTKAGWAGNSYKVELFEDGTWRTLWSCEIGNKYDSPGVIIKLPVLNDNGLAEAQSGEFPMSEDDYLNMCFISEEQEIAEILRAALAE